MNRDRAVSRYERRAPAPGRERPYGASPEAAGRRRPTPAKGGGNWFKQHKILTSLLVFLVVALGAVAAIALPILTDPGSVLTNRNNGGLLGSLKGTATPQAGATAGAATGVSITPQPAMANFPKEIVNFLILGTDADSKRVKEGMNARTDCIIVASVNTNTKKVSLVSIPRDTYVMIYDEKGEKVSRNKINAAFSFGGGLKKDGIAYAVNTVIQYLGGAIPIDHYVLFDMDLVKNLINDVGGVTVDVDISVSVKSVGVSLKPGKQKLNGLQALTYARDRHNTKGGDIGRGGHQQQVMIALLKELQNKGNIITKIPELYNSFVGNVTTNPELGVAQIGALAVIAKDVDVSSIKQYSMGGQNGSINGASIVVTDQQQKQEIIKEVFGVDYKMLQSETYESMKKEAGNTTTSSSDVISRANSLLKNNKKYYTADEAEALKNAISAYQTAQKAKDSDAMAEALDNVRTEYDILNNLIKKNKAAGSATPKPTSQQQATDAPAATNSPTDAPALTETPATEAPTEPPAEQPVNTPEPASTDEQAQPVG